MASSSTTSNVPSVLMVGTGEYTTGYTGTDNVSDKGAGVVAIVMFHLRSKVRTWQQTTGYTRYWVCFVIQHIAHPAILHEGQL
jgi:hypothetical protein